jgi:hypothetical protein
VGLFLETKIANLSFSAIWSSLTLLCYLAARASRPPLFSSTGDLLHDPGGCGDRAGGTATTKPANRFFQQPVKSTAARNLASGWRNWPPLQVQRKEPPPPSSRESLIVLFSPRPYMYILPLRTAPSCFWLLAQTVGLFPGFVLPRPFVFNEIGRFAPIKKISLRSCRRLTAQVPSSDFRIRAPGCLLPIVLLLMVEFTVHCCSFIATFPCLWAATYFASGSFFPRCLSATYR